MSKLEIALFILIALILLYHEWSIKQLIDLTKTLYRWKLEEVNKEADGQQ